MAAKYGVTNSGQRFLNNVATTQTPAGAVKAFRIRRILKFIINSSEGKLTAKGLKTKVRVPKFKAEFDSIWITMKSRGYIQIVR